MNNFAILIPAAGSSTRMKGRDKLLEDVGGEPLLRRVVKRAIATGAQVFVTLPVGSPRLEVLADLAVTTVLVADPETGMSASFRAIAPKLAKSIKALLVALPDMPDITGQDMALLLSAFAMFPDTPILRAATPDGTAGHPVVLPQWTFKDLPKLQGDTGPRDILKKHADKVALIPLTDDRAILDLDTPADWAKWRARA
ncbi:NTP transferase domain-containing protein [Falsihalocynthiibacter sp. S25ZX9]|uniref:nucleotidyltransferase family protein n=1 Tax=Falsihalocynthiibacter sp. S25ZX9 TaxID=3240870 RepID=UPI00351065CB